MGDLSSDLDEGNVHEYFAGHAPETRGYGAGGYGSIVYDLAGKLKRKMHNPREGWGLSNDGTNLIFSDGGPSFYFVDPRTFAIRKSVRIRTNRPGDVEGLNELELVGGKLFGNIFTTRAIVRLDPESGCIDGIADLSALWQAMSPEERAEIDTPDSVLNGIA